LATAANSDISPEFVKNPASADNLDKRFTPCFCGRENVAESNPQMPALSGGLGRNNL
jgi:hypothetical protein